MPDLQLEKINTVYCECISPVWNYYIQNDNLKYKPVVWLGRKKQFPEKYYDSIHYVDRLKVANAEYEVNETVTGGSFDEIFNDILYEMYKRDSVSFRDNEEIIQRLNRYYLNFWINLINKFDLKAIIFRDAPHLPYSYIGYLVFKKLKLKTIFSPLLPLLNRTFFRDSIENYNLFSGKNDGFKLQDGNPENEEYLKKLGDEFKLMGTKEKKIPVINSYIKINYIYCKQFISRANVKHEFKQLNKNNFIFLSNFIYTLYSVKQSFRKLQAKKLYSSKAEKFKKGSGVNILFALQFEPELAVHPLAGSNFNQTECAIKLAERLGDKGTLYIKEHPWIFNYTFPKARIRKSMYEQLSRYDNIKLIDHDFNLGRNIHEFDIIATLTGTIGWEAFLNKIPVIVFGHTWYEGLPGIYRFGKDTDINNIITDFKNIDGRVDYKEVYEYMNENLYNFSLTNYDLSPEKSREYSVLLADALNRM